MSATYKNGSEVAMCLESEEIILPEETIIADNAKIHQHKMWDPLAAAVVKSLYTVVMSLCDATMDDKVMSHEDYPELKHTRNSLKILQVIKQFMYSHGSKDLHTVQNQLMSTINLLTREGEITTEFPGAVTVMRQVCDQLGLCIGQTEQGNQVVLKREGMINPSDEQLKEAK